jgi:acyl-CoA synthetase (AMP-forming)/AMP-acid ligase II
MTLLSLTSLWWTATSQFGLICRPSGPSQPSYGPKMARSSHVDVALTYAQLHDSVQSISSQLLNVPLQRGDTVVVLCSPGLQLVEIIFGCQRAGLLSVPVFPPDPCSGEDSCHHLIRALSQTKPKAARITSQMFGDTFLHPSMTTSLQRCCKMSSGFPRIISKIKRYIFQFFL